ncbi:MAG: glycoside hydrolase [Anaerolineae bacterium]|nr:glycoside hydrolase [Anaerolineae bacterium]MCA9893072.1 glycoside hydrolase [Anaerolineae bacterium]
MTNELIRGAVYLPARAYNHYQQWRDYNPAEAERDLGFAASVNLNALRLWVSYHHWLEDAAHLEASFRHFVDTAQKYGIRILPVLFEQCGIEPTPEALVDTHPKTGMCIKSPGSSITDDSDAWGKAIDFTMWFVDKFGADARLLAIESMNEPITVEELAFAREITQQLKQHADLPVTLGIVGGIHSLVYYGNWDLDIFQFHMNFPASTTAMEEALREAQGYKTRTGNRPIWLTEWQRVRPSGTGWGNDALTDAELGPDLASLAPLIHHYEISNFFWSLMLKPAYLPPQRAKGTFNGLFHEDGTVWSLADARAVSGNPDLMLEERKVLPDWFTQVNAE